MTFALLWRDHTVSGMIMESGRVATAVEASKAVRRMSTLPPRSSRPVAANASLAEASLFSSAADRYWASKASIKARDGWCHRCWIREEACVCEGMGTPAAAPIDVVVCVHAREWGKSSNSATVLAATVSNCRLLMKGVDDDELWAMLNARKCALLWPAADSTSTITPRQCLDDGRLLIVPDGSWRNARRIVNALPPDMPRLSLASGDVLLEALRVGGGDATSLLAPLRATNGNRDESRVCTCQAAVAALRAMGHSDVACDRILEALCHKVAVVAALRGLRGAQGGLLGR